MLRSTKAWAAFRLDNITGLLPVIFIIKVFRSHVHYFELVRYILSLTHIITLHFVNLINLNFVKRRMLAFLHNSVAIAFKFSLRLTWTWFQWGQWRILNNDRWSLTTLYVVSRRCFYLKQVWLGLQLLWDFFRRFGFRCSVLIQMNLWWVLRYDTLLCLTLKICHNFRFLHLV